MHCIVMQLVMDVFLYDNIYSNIGSDLAVPYKKRTLPCVSKVNRMAWSPSVTPTERASSNGIYSEPLVLPSSIKNMLSQNTEDNCIGRRGIIDQKKKELGKSAGKLSSFCPRSAFADEAENYTLSSY